MNNKIRHLIFERFRSKNPHPTTELHFTSPFELLIAVVLSAQATDTSVNKATEELFKIANTPTAFLALGENELKNHIKTIGLYNNKAKNIIKICALLVEKYEGFVPSTRQELESLPGVGRKTANVILNTVFNQPTIAVDTHVFRVANRTGIAPGKTPLSVEEALLRNIDKEFILHAHHWLVLHGRYICIARRPRCNVCFIRDLCEYKDKTL